MTWVVLTIVFQMRSQCVPNEFPTIFILVPKLSQSPEMFNIVF
jgi:hypothetical protein